jgi:hypothetical protein
LRELGQVAPAVRARRIFLFICRVANRQAAAEPAFTAQPSRWNMVFEDDDLSTIGQAFDRAWDLFLRRGLLTPHNLDDSRHFIAKQILEKARAGDRDEWKLARNALARWSDVVQNPAAIVGVSGDIDHRARR